MCSSRDPKLASWKSADIDGFSQNTDPPGEDYFKPENYASEQNSIQCTQILIYYNPYMAVEAMD